ncbi:MAG: tRNA uridine-5-carboxymethylaminomethyl(34) synthesis GTPase MnmE, partial [Burkholderiales bacterium]
MHSRTRAKSDTIVAIATPSGRGGVGVIRISGSDLRAFAERLTGRELQPRMAALATVRDEGGNALDQVIALYFQAPASYTGEDVIELQGHGGPAVMQALLARCLTLGCRLARAGEFTERAYLNDKLDLVEAEAVADLIDAASVEAVKSAARSLAGEFSARVHALVAQLTDLRMHVEACIDFPEEEIDAADRQTQQTKLQQIRADWDTLARQAKQGAVLREGLTVALIGRPNVGKSSLLNCLAGDDIAIVTPIAGTTRDQVRATIHLEGVPIHLIDTAGLRDTDDVLERIGMERTWAAVKNASAALLICEAGEAMGAAEAQIAAKLPVSLPIAWVYNKIDLFGRPHGGQNNEAGVVSMPLSAMTGEGVDALRAWLLKTAGWTPIGEGVVIARQRHLIALQQVKTHLEAADLV